jgi:hypothetical protein
MNGGHEVGFELFADFYLFIFSSTVTAAYVADRNNKKIEWSINTILRTTFFILRHAKVGRAPLYLVRVAVVLAYTTVVPCGAMCVRHVSQDNSPEVLGASVFSYNDVYVRLSTFLNELRQERKRKKLPRLYFVSMDIKSCFNNINQHKVYEVRASPSPNHLPVACYSHLAHMPSGCR